MSAEADVPPECICTRRVAVVPKELNVPYELIPVDIWKGEQHSEEHLARQPFAEVPVIEDDGLQLFESRAIGRYLVAKYGAGSSLVPDPKDIVATAKFEQAAAIENNDFNSTGGAIVVELFWNPSNGIPTDSERVKSLVKTMERKLDAYEKILSRQKYLAGDVRIRIIDLDLGGVEERACPHVDKRGVKVVLADVEACSKMTMS